MATRVIVKNFQYLILMSKLGGSSLRANENGIVLEVNAFWWYIKILRDHMLIKKLLTDAMPVNHLRGH